MNRLLLSVITVSLLLGFGCGKKEEEKNEPPVKEDKLEKKSPEKGTPKTGPTSAKKNKKGLANPTPSISLAQIPVCDKYVKFVCACGKKHPESYQMNQACKLAKATYPQWKRGSGKSREEQETIIKACSKSIMIIKSNNLCNDVK